jgi:intron-binding protein aquarius
LPQGTEFQRANAGLTYDYQLINVEDFNGMGETSPWPHAFQNIGEAQFVISVFQFLRLCGHPADRITILTPYNGQKQLLQDLVEQRCAPFPVFGRPSKVATVDHYQGQQNDIVLLSLVRTRHVGHLRDVRRLVVAVRARSCHSSLQLLLA